MTTGSVPTSAVLLLVFASAVTGCQAIRLRGILDDVNFKKRYEHTTQADAYSSATGQNPGGPGDAFTWNEAESSSSSSYNGVYYADGRKVVEAGDLAKAGWAGAYSKNDADLGTTSAISALLDSEYATQRGVHTVSGTSEGARAVAGSSSMYGFSSDPGSVATWTMDSYGPTADKNIAVGDRRKSVAFTDIAPQSAAQAGTGSGPAAIATGWEVSAAARSHRDKPVPVTVGSRDTDDTLQVRTGVFGGSNTAAKANAGKETGIQTNKPSPTTAKLDDVGEATGPASR